MKKSERKIIAKSINMLKYSSIMWQKFVILSIAYMASISLVGCGGNDDDQNSEQNPIICGLETGQEDCIAQGCEFIPAGADGASCDFQETQASLDILQNAAICKDQLGGVMVKTCVSKCSTRPPIPVIKFEDIEQTWVNVTYLQLAHSPTQIDSEPFVYNVWSELSGRRCKARIWKDANSELEARIDFNPERSCLPTGEDIVSLHYRIGSIQFANLKVALEAGHQGTEKCTNRNCAIDSREADTLKCVEPPEICETIRDSPSICLQNSEYCSVASPTAPCEALDESCSDSIKKPNTNNLAGFSDPSTTCPSFCSKVSPPICLLPNGWQCDIYQDSNVCGYVTTTNPTPGELPADATALCAYNDGTDARCVQPPVEN